MSALLNGTSERGRGDVIGGTPERDGEANRDGLSPAGLGPAEHAPTGLADAVRDEGRHADVPRGGGVAVEAIQACECGWRLEMGNRYYFYRYRYCIFQSNRYRYSKKYRYLPIPIPHL